jgi:hypothetical protein
MIRGGQQCVAEVAKLKEVTAVTEVSTTETELTGRAT